MAELERPTITMPGKLAAVIKTAVAEGGYASTSQAVREALRDWKIKRAIQHEEIAALKVDIDKGLADVAVGRVTELNTGRIIEGEKSISRAQFIHLTDSAEADLAELWAYIATESSEAVATRFLSDIEHAFQPLLYTPLMGPRRGTLGSRIACHFSWFVRHLYLPATT